LHGTDERERRKTELTDRIVPKELLDDLGVIGAPMHEYIEALRIDVGPGDSSLKNQRRAFDLLLPILEAAEIREPGDLDSPLARRRLLDVMIAEAPKRLDGMLSTGTPGTLDRRLSEFRMLLRVGGCSGSALTSLKRGLKQVRGASGLRQSPRENLTLEQRRAFFDTIEAALDSDEIHARSNRVRILEGTTSWKPSTSRPTLLRVRLAALLHSTGRRRSDVLSLRRADLSTEEVVFSIVKSRDYPEEFTTDLAPWLAPFVEAALEVMPDDPDEPLIRPDSYQRVVRAAWVASGLPGNADLHGFRHLALDAILDAGLGIEVGAAHLAHRDISTTGRYRDARRVTKDRAQGSKAAMEALRAAIMPSSAENATIPLPPMTREVDGSLTLDEPVSIGDHEFDRLYPAISSGPVETDAGTMSITIYSNHRVTTKTNSSGFTEPLDYEFTFSNPTVMLFFDGDDYQIIATSPSLLAEVVGNTGFEPVSGISEHLLRLISSASIEALADLDRGDDGSARSLLNLLARMGVRP